MMGHIYCLLFSVQQLVTIIICGETSPKFCEPYIELGGQLELHYKGSI